MPHVNYLQHNYNLIFSLSLFFTPQGDSGGPLVAVNQHNQYTLLGAVSFGLDGCASYSVYARVTHFMPWIEATIATNSGSVSGP